jgi:hypothetical protein
MIQANTVFPEDWNKIILPLEIEEAVALFKFLEHQHISYEEPELLEVVRKISRFVAMHTAQ